MSITSYLFRSALTVVAAAICLPAHAQFGDLLKKLNIQLPTQPQMAPAQSMPSRAGAVSEDKSAGVSPSDQWCAQASGALGNLKVNTSLISSEFKVKELISLQDDFLNAFKQKQISKTFPNAHFFSASFFCYLRISLPLAFFLSLPS